MATISHLLLVLLSASLVTYSRQLSVGLSEDGSFGDSPSANSFLNDGDKQSRSDKVHLGGWERERQPENDSQDEWVEEGKSEEVPLGDWERGSQSENDSPGEWTEESKSEKVPIDNWEKGSQSEDSPYGNWYKESQSEFTLSDPRRFKREAEDIDWEKVMDNILEEFRKQTNQEISLPDLNKIYSVPGVSKLFPHLPSLKLQGSQGFLRSIHSIHRVGHVIVDGQTITTLFQFGSLRLRYEDFKASVLKVGPHGRLDATMEKAELSVRARVERSGADCKVVYEDVEMVQLDNMKLKMTGLGPLNRFYSFVATKILKVLKHCVSDSLERLFAAKLRSMFENYPFKCE